MNQRRSLFSPPALSLFTALFLLIPAVVSVPAQDARLSLQLGDEVDITVRWSYSTRLNGRYQGQTSREALLLLSERSGASTPGGTLYRGELMVNEATMRNSFTIAQRVADRREALVEYQPSGDVIVQDGKRAPLFRGVPHFPSEAVSPGDTWQAPGAILFYLADDTIVSVPVLTEYTYVGTELYQDQQVHRVTGLYAVRAPLSRGELGSHPARALVSGLPTLPDDYILHGRHELTVLLPVAGGPPVFQRTAIQEQLRYPSGDVEERSGFILTWYRSTGDFSSPDEAAQIAARIQESGVEDVSVRATEDNRVSLSLQNLQFVADQATLLPGEESRLDGIAAALESVPDRSILVIGHTADVGTGISQVELSYERARKIVDELVARGISAGRLSYDGRGGREPVAPNDTEEGRAQNRRVEIEILPARN